MADHARAHGQRGRGGRGHGWSADAVAAGARRVLGRRPDLGAAASILALCAAISAAVRLDRSGPLPDTHPPLAPRPAPVALPDGGVFRDRCGALLHLDGGPTDSDGAPTPVPFEVLALERGPGPRGSEMAALVYDGAADTVVRVTTGHELHRFAVLTVDAAGVVLATPTGPERLPMASSAQAGADERRVGP